MTLLTKFQGAAVIAVYALFIYGITWFFARGFGRDKTGFLLANRKVTKWQSAFSIAATWVWAPALFIASQKAYLHGFAGIFWFTVPNVACLVIFAFFAQKIRKLVPDGFTLSAFIRDKYSKRVQAMYLIELLGLAACSFAVQLLAGAKIITMVAGINFCTVTIIMAFIAIVYSMAYGLKASIVTDYFQMLLIIIIGSGLVAWTVINAGGMSVISSGLGGLKGTYKNLFSSDSLELALTFGIPVTIGLIAGPFGDQSFWQRAFATEERDVKKAFIYGAGIFAFVPLIMSFPGFAAAGLSMEVTDPGTVNLSAVMALLPLWTIVPFVFILLSGLISTLDSNLCAISSLAGHDFSLNIGEDKNTFNSGISRWSMAGVSVLAIGIANIPGLKIVHLFLFYGTLRASTLLPTVFTFLGIDLSEKGLFYGIILSIVLGLPLFAYGKLTGNTDLIIGGSLFTVLASGICAAVPHRIFAGGKHDRI